jgi:hypothetical protein
MPTRRRRVPLCGPSVAEFVRIQTGSTGFSKTLVHLSARILSAVLPILQGPNKHCWASQQWHPADFRSSQKTADNGHQHQYRFAIRQNSKSDENLPTIAV